MVQKFNFSKEKLIIFFYSNIPETEYSLKTINGIVN